MDHELTDPGAAASARGRVSRRAMIATTSGAVGAAWIIPSVLNAPAAAAASSLAAVVAGTAVHVQGNAATFAAKDMPAGTFTRLVLVVSIVANNTGSTGPSALQPTQVSTTGWTNVTSVVDGAPPGFGVFIANPGAAPPAVSSQNLTNGRLSAVVLGWSAGTAVTTSTIASAVGPATSLTVPSATAPAPATWVFVGSASEGIAANNWAPLPGAQWSAVVPDTGGSSNTPPDMYVARRTALLTTIPSLSETFFQGGSAGGNYGARGVFIGVS